MIWTIICFLIALFVLKRYAFGPIQGAIDKRRERIRESIEEADRAREEARKLLEEHRKLIGQAKSDAEAILAEARKQSDAQRERVREETEEDRQRRLEDTKKQIAAETQRALDQIRTEVADLTLIATAEGDRQGARPRRPAEADRGRDLRARLLRAGAERLGVSVVHRTYARALYDAAREAGRLAAVRQDLGDFVEATRGGAGARRDPPQPQPRQAREDGRRRGGRGRVRSARRQLPPPAGGEGARRRRRRGAPRSSSASPPRRRAS